MTQRVSSRPLALAATVACVLLAMPHAGGAQSIRDRIKQRVKEKAGQMVDQKADSATEAVINKGSDAVKCVVSDKKCIKKANDAGQAVVVTDRSGTPLPNQQEAAKEAGVAARAASAAPAAPAAPAASAASAGSPAPAAAAAPEASTPAPGAGVWLNYDFVPGERTIWYENFEGNEVGDFPRRMRLREGNLEVVNVKGKMMLRSVKGGSFFVKLPEKLPERFTVEIRFHSPLANPIDVSTTESTWERSAGFGCFSNKAYVEAHNAGGANSGDAFQSDAPTGFVSCTFTVDNGKGIKAYIDEHRTANAPQTHVVLTDTLFIATPSTSEEDPMLIESIRVAAGGKKLYDVLAAKGRVSTQGILFDTGSDRIRGESTPTLKEIGEMLQQHADLQLTVEGHTDNVGQPAANQTLSEKRAAAVVQYLVQQFGIDAGRVTSKGFGATKPVAPNTTPEGRQNNRRVELVKR